MPKCQTYKIVILSGARFKLTSMHERATCDELVRFRLSFRLLLSRIPFLPTVQKTFRATLRLQ